MSRWMDRSVLYIFFIPFTFAYLYLYYIKIKYNTKIIHLYKKTVTGRTFIFCQWSRIDASLATIFKNVANSAEEFEAEKHNFQVSTVKSKRRKMEKLEYSYNIIFIHIFVRSMCVWSTYLKF